MTQDTDVKIVVTSDDKASAILQQLKTEIDKTRQALEKLAAVKVPDLSGILGPAKRQGADIRAEAAQRRMFDDADVKRLRERMGIMSRMSRQRAAEGEAEGRAQRTRDAASMADLRRRMAFITRMGRQQAAEERTHDRERQRVEARAERDATASLRRRIAGDRYRFELRQRMDRQERQERDRTRRETIGRARDTYRSGRAAARDGTRPPALAAVASTAAAGTAVRKILGAESTVDAAEISTRAYGGLSAEAARKLRDDWAAPLAEALGVEQSKLLTAWTDATKLGIPAAGAKAFSELATKTSEAWEVPFDAVSDILGTVNSLLTSTGQAFDADRLKSVANTVQHLAAGQSTTPEKLISFLQRGAGAAQVLGMSQEAGLAFGSASTSLGNQAGQSGRLFDFLASRVIEMPRLTKGHGQEARQARDLMQSLGYGSSEAMDRKRRANPDAFVPDLVERFAKIKNKKKQDEAIRFFAGREWLGEFGRLAKGIDTYKEAVKLQKEAKGLDAIGKVWDLHRLKLSFVFKQFKAGWLNILGEFGKELTPLARTAGDYFLEWTAKLRQGGLSVRFKAMIDGFIKGLGFEDFKGLLEGVFGKPGEGNAGSIKAWGDAARGFGEGLRDVGNAIKAVFSVFSGGDNSPETIGRLTAEILGFTAALMIVSPILTVMAGIVSAILAFGSAALTVWNTLKLAGLVGGTGGAAGAIGASVFATAGGLIGVAFLASIAEKLGILKTPDVSKGWGRAVVEFLDPGLADRLFNKQGDSAKSDTGKDESRTVPAWVDPPARVQKQSASEDWRGLIHKAVAETRVDPRDKQPWVGGTALQRSVPHTAAFFRDMDLIAKRLAFAMDSADARRLNAGVAGTGRAAVDSFATPPGMPGDPAKAFGSNFYTPGRKVPGWFGKGSSGGNGMPDPGAGTGAYKPVLDHIAQSEGTAGQAGGGYNTSLGYGKFLPGGVETNLTGKSLNEILALGDHMRRQPGNPNSSALGRYQIVGKTLRGLMTKLGLKGDEKFDEAMQDRLGAELVRQRGADPNALHQEWASLGGAKGQRAAELVGAIPRGASTAPGAREAAGGGGDVLGRIGELRRSGAISGTECVDLVKAYTGTKGMTTKDWRRGASAVDGMLKPGDAVATFLDSNFRQSDRYAGGTGGKAGAHKDHAAIFQKYIDDATGRHIGMQVMEQFNKTRGRQVSRNYMFGQGYGEGDGANYAAVLGPDGKPLGEINRIMSPSPTAQAAADGMKSPGGWRRGAGGNAAALAGGAATVDGLADSIPQRTPWTRTGGSGGGSDRPSGDVHITNHIHGGHQSPEEIAGHVQRHVQEAWSKRAHDLEPELT